AANSDPVVDTARSNLNAIWLAIGGRLPGMPPCTTRTCLLTGLGTVGKNGQPIIHLDSKGQPDTILGGLGQVAYGNPNFNKRQAALGGRTPHDYLKECPYCWEKGRAVYNPATANPKFQPYLSDGLSLLSEGLGDVIKQVQTLDASNPGLVEGLRQMNTGLGTMLAGVQSFDPKNPGLVDGLQQVLAGVGQLSSGVSQLKTQGVDAAAKGVSGGVDDVQLRKAIIAEQTRELQTYSFLAQGAQTAFVSYVMDLPAQSTLSHDNLMRAVLIVLAIILVMVAGRVFGRRLGKSGTGP
ncbi:MAG: hypothetical protein ACXVBV_20965, partial [Isosphaeraceae bacterium]